MILRRVIQPTHDIAAHEGRAALYRQALRTGISTEVQRALARHCGDRPRAVGNCARLVDFTVNNKDIMDGLQAIAAGKP